MSCWTVIKLERDNISGLLSWTQRTFRF